VGWAIGIIGILFAIKTKKDFTELKLMLKKSIEIIGNLEKKLEFMQQQRITPTAEEEITEEMEQLRVGTEWDKRQWIKTDPVKEVINYGIEQFGKKVIDDLLGIGDDFKFECPNCGTPLYEDEVKCPECGEEFDE
jgi:rubrerythrin